MIVVFQQFEAFLLVCENSPKTGTVLLCGEDGSEENQGYAGSVLGVR